MADAACPGELLIDSIPTLGGSRLILAFQTPWGCGYLTRYLGRRWHSPPTPPSPWGADRCRPARLWLRRRPTGRQPDSLTMQPDGSEDQAR